jgi:hypothetical protein
MWRAIQTKPTEMGAAVLHADRFALVTSRDGDSRVGRECTAPLITDTTSDPQNVHHVTRVDFEMLSLELRPTRYRDPNPSVIICFSTKH